MTGINDNYEKYIDYIKNTPQDNIRSDVMIQIKRNMFKRTIIKIAELSIIALTTLNLVPAFLG